MPALSPPFKLQLPAYADLVLARDFWVLDQKKTNYFAVRQAVTAKFLHCVAIKMFNGALKKIFRHLKTHLLLFPWKVNRTVPVFSRRLQASGS